MWTQFSFSFLFLFFIFFVIYLVLVYFYAMDESKTRGTVPDNARHSDTFHPNPEPPPPYQASTSSNVPHSAHTTGPQFVGIGPQITTGATVITTQPGITIIPGTRPGPRPTLILCRSCNYQIVTRVEYMPSMRTHLVAAILCLVGCWPFICVPYCIDSCNNADHFCPNCNAYIGSYRA